MHIHNKFKLSFIPGFTLIEVLIVVTIIAVLSVAALVYILPSLNRGRDGRRKSDLHELGILLESYYSDTGSYPSDIAMSTCGLDNQVLASYEKKVPCEPEKEIPYLYISEPVGCNGTESNRCSAYRLLTALAYSQDPDIKKLGCDLPDGCFQKDGITYTYGIAKGRAVADK